jgi:DNA-binding beta-propeller fold protein YncE
MSRDDDSVARWGSVAAWTRGWQEPVQQRTPLPSERYCVDAELGRGGMGVVHAATDRWLGRQVALKRPRADLAIQRMVREASITARLTHPSIAPVLDVGEDGLGPFYTMPILIGEAPCPTSPLFRWVQMVRDAALAVAHAHAQGIVHRDLKPDNLLWGDQYQLWVLDWGVAYDPASPDTAVVGTPGFAAPEQQQGACSPASDVYGLGRILQRHPELDTALLAVVERATDPEPAVRYADGLALADELERWMSGGRVRAHRYTFGEMARVWLAQNRGLAAVTLGGLVTVAALVVGVFVVQARAQTRTNHALAQSFVQRAESLSLTGARAEAEVYASHALSLADLPAARGVLMRWAASPRPVQVGTRPPVCLGRWTLYGERVCVSETEAVWKGLDGAERGRATIDRNVTSGYSETDVAFFGSEVLTAGPPIQWVDGVPHVLHLDSGATRLALGPVPAYSHGGNVYRVDMETHARELWVEHACTGDIQEVVTEREPVVNPDGEQRIEIPGHPVLARWLGDLLVVATFDAEIVLWDGTEWTRIPTGAGPVTTAVSLDDERLLVTTERMVTRVFDRTLASWVLDLPRGFDTSVPTPAGLRGVNSSSTVDYEWTWDGLGAGLDASALGGVAGMALHADGTLLAIGHSQGTVDLWNTQTGELQRSALPGGNVAKALLWRGDALWVNNGQNHVWTDGTWEHLPRQGFARSLFGVAGRVARWAVPGKVFYQGEDTLDTEVVSVLPAPSDIVSDGQKLWAIDSNGQVRTIDTEGYNDEFVVPAPGRVIVVSEDRVAVATEREVMLLTRSGERLWASPATSPVTELALDERFVVVGSQTGRVYVYDATTGVLLAEHQPHTRRVSRLILMDDVLFTGSWDGLVTRMGLGPLTASPRSLRDQVSAAWSLSEDDLRD